MPRCDRQEDWEDSWLIAQAESHGLRGRGTSAELHAMLRTGLEASGCGEAEGPPLRRREGAEHLRVFLVLFWGLVGGSPKKRGFLALRTRAPSAFFSWGGWVPQAMASAGFLELRLATVAVSLFAGGTPRMGVVVLFSFPFKVQPKAGF